MKKTLKFSLAVLLSAITFSCGDELVEKVMIDPLSVVGGDISPLTNSTLVLLYADANGNIDSIRWAATDYGFATSVVYTLQIDVKDNEFADAVNLVSTLGLAATVNVEDLNDALVTNLSLAPEMAAALELRVISVIAGEFGDIISAPMDITITPYDPNIPPIYLLGDGQGWNFDNAVVLSSIAPLQYLGFADFKEDETFRFFEFNDWADTGTQWGYSYFDGVIPSEFGNNGDADSNFIFNSDVEGTYSVTVDLSAKTIVIEKQLFPNSFYVIGADQGWSLEEALAMRHVGGGVFEAVETLGSGNIWRFFETPSWGATQWNYNTFADGTIDSDLSGTTEGDANFTFNGTTGIYKITVKTLDLVIEIEPAETPTMYRVGGDNGWSFADSGAPMTWIRGEKFTQSTTLTSGNEWRFFPSFEVWGFTRDYNAFNNVDATLWTGPNGGDANFLNQVTGSYTITIDVVPGVITAVQN